MTGEEPVRDQAPGVDGDRWPDPARDRDRDPSRNSREVTDPTASGRDGAVAELGVATVARAAAGVLRPYAQAQLAQGEFAASRRAWELAVRQDGIAVFHSANAISESERARAARTRWTSTEGTTPPSVTSHLELPRATAVRLRLAQIAQSALRQR